MRKQPKSYKKLYETTLDIKIPEGYEIHHLNFDHKDNRIENLLMLPKETHKNYHYLHNKLEPIELTYEIRSINMGGDKQNYYFDQYYQDFIRVYIECCKWMDYKEFLLGNIPNIHGIEIENL